MKYIRPPKPDFTTILLTNKYKCIMKKNLYDVTRRDWQLCIFPTPPNGTRDGGCSKYYGPNATCGHASRHCTSVSGNGALHPANTKWSSTSSANRRRRTTTSASGRTNRPAIHRQEAPWKTGENAHFQAETDGNVHERAIMHTPVFGDTYLCIVIRMTRELQNQKTNF